LKGQARLADKLKHIGHNCSFYWQKPAISTLIQPEEGVARTTMKLKLPLIALFFALFVTTTAQADPLFFSNTVALQNSGSTRVDLFSNPGTTLTGPTINFLVDISGVVPASGADTLRITFTEVGGATQTQTFRIPLFDAFPPPYSQLFTFTLQNTASPFQDVTLRVDIVGDSADFIIPSGVGAGNTVDSQTYSFRVAQPVPEPASMILAGLGLFGVAVNRRRARRASC
jgi:hypothetical protein